MLQNPVRRLLKPFLVPGSKQRMQEDVIRLERSIGFEFAAPVAVLVLLRKKKFPRSRDRRAHARAQFLNFSEAKLWVRTEGAEARWESGELCPSFINSSCLGEYAAGGSRGTRAAAMASTISGGSPKRTFSGITSSSCRLSNPLLRRNVTVSSTRHSGADAPAVSAIVFTSFNHSASMSLQLSIRCAFVPRLRATSTKPVRIRTVFRSHHQQQIRFGRHLLHRDLPVLRA